MSERLKRWFPIWKHILAVIVLALFLALVLWNRTHFWGYFPEWLSRRMSSHIFVGVIAILLVYWGKWAIASGLTLGYVGGVPVAQWLGDMKYAADQALVRPDMTEAERYALSGHDHAYIWWGCIAVGVLLGFVVQIVVWIRKKRKNAQANSYES